MDGSEEDRESLQATESDEAPHAGFRRRRGRAARAPKYLPADGKRTPWGDAEVEAVIESLKRNHNSAFASAVEPPVSQ